MRFCRVTTFHLPGCPGGDAVPMPSRALVRAGHDVQVSTRCHAAFATRLAVLRHRDVGYALPRMHAHGLRSDAVRRRRDGGGARAWLPWRAALHGLRERP
jgi:hypothetical protein